MKALQELRNVARDPYKTAARWKASNKKVMGYRCLYVPEEIISASGMLPFPLYGTPEPVGLADSYFQSCTCEFVRNLFDLALKNKMGFLDGLALPNTCDAMRRLVDLWDAYIEQTPVYILNNPQKLGSDGNRGYFMEELNRFKSWVEGISGVKITEEKLRKAIALHNETRNLLSDLYDLRRRDDPPITAEEALDVCMAATILPKYEVNPLLRQLMEELPHRPSPGRSGPRIMVTGSIIDYPDLLKMIEEEGGNVVVEDLCNTSRYFWHKVETDGDPMNALYNHLNKRVVCACMHPFSARMEYLVELVDRFDVEAVINLNLKYCHPFLYEAPLVRKTMDSRQVPITILEMGHDRSGHGQLRTRIQAFIEMVEL